MSAKPKIFFDLLRLEGRFDATSSWLYRFKKRSGIKEFRVHGEKLSSDHQAAEDFRFDFEEFVLSEDLS